jgi:hypothetical protein
MNINSGSVGLRGVGSSGCCCRIFLGSLGLSAFALLVDVVLVFPLVLVWTFAVGVSSIRLACCDYIVMHLGHVVVVLEGL